MFLCHIARNFPAVAGDCQLTFMTYPYVNNCRGISAAGNWTRLDSFSIRSPSDANNAVAAFGGHESFFTSPVTNAPKRRTVSRSVSFIEYSFPVGTWYHDSQTLLRYFGLLLRHQYKVVLSSQKPGCDCDWLKTSRCNLVGLLA